MQVSVVIPARNEEKNIATVIDHVRSVSKDYEIIVIDDGSTDKTYEIAKQKKVKIIKLSQNRGKGYACRLGVSKASGKYIAFIDSDLQLDPKEIPKMVKELNMYDLVNGYRKMDHIPLTRRFANRFARFVVNRIMGTNFKDILCGMKAIRKEKFEELNLKQDRYEFESEMMINAVKKNFKIKEVEISVKYHGEKGMSLIDSLKVSYFQIKQFFRK